MKQSYTVTEDADMLAPEWLAVRFNYATVKLLYRTVDGAAKVKGVRIGNEVAEIGDVIHFNGKRLSIERRRFRCLPPAGNDRNSKGVMQID